MDDTHTRTAAEGARLGYCGSEYLEFVESCLAPTINSCPWLLASEAFCGFPLLISLAQVSHTRLCVCVFSFQSVSCP